MKRKHILLLLLLSSVLLLGFGLGYSGQAHLRGQIMYIDTPRVFEAFVMSQVLNRQLQQTQQARTRLLDSLQQSARALAASLGHKSPALARDSLQRLLAQLEQKEILLAENQQRQSQAYTNQIWQQLNQYIQDFRAREQYSFILGASGDGRLMAAAPEHDLTETVIAYVNRRYGGEAN